MQFLLGLFLGTPLGMLTLAVDRRLDEEEQKMNKQEFIDKLREHGAWCTECHDIHGEKDRYVKVAKVRELIEQIEEPKQDKPVVKQCVAEWYEENKENLEYCISEYIYEWDNQDSCDFKKWINTSENNPIETLIKMKLFGYTVNPKRWVVVNKKGRYFMHFNSDAEHPFEKVFGFDASDGYPFTNRAKADAVALLVEGSVEEV